MADANARALLGTHVIVAGPSLQRERSRSSPEKSGVVLCPVTPNARIRSSIRDWGKLRLMREIPQLARKNLRNTLMMAEEFTAPSLHYR